MASDASVIAIAAPAGYGKSALLAEWSAVDPRPFAWVSVDAADNDPGALLRYIAAAYAEVAPIDAGVLDVVAEATTQPWPEGSAILGDAVSRMHEPVVLVLDGGDLVSSGSVAVLERLIDRLGPGSMMVVSGREPSVAALAEAAPGAAAAGAWPPRPRSGPG